MATQTQTQAQPGGSGWINGVWQQISGTQHPTQSTQSGTSSTTAGKPYAGPGAQTAQSGSTPARLLSDLDNLLNAHGLLGSLNVVSDVQVLTARAVVVGVGFVFGIAGLILVVTAIGREVPKAVKDVPGAATAATLAAAAA